ncbi:Eco57I restriction-modification methylase domain-containing protein [Novosphingopyxis sp.]|uniref:Eco57I restriction-modification methylase domain-containing protein n=1 Tax=Novosphingopyxis sp. TaxID=2709690 RepID=UPI003B596D46
MQLFAGSFLTTDYLEEAIRQSAEYRAVDGDALRSALTAIAERFPRGSSPNESQTEDDFIWPVLAELGWSESLRQQNLSAGGRLDVPDGLLFIDGEAKDRANAKPEEWRRYEQGAAVVESKRWARPLDRAVGREDAVAPSTQMLRYLRRIGDNSEHGLRWGILTNGARWRLYWAGARSVSEEFLEVDLAGALALDTQGELGVDDDVRDHALRVFAAIFSHTAFARTGADGRSFHERARAEAAFYEERVAKSLSKLVFEDIFPALTAAVAGASPQTPLEEVRDASLVLLYRLLFLLYAEDRDLLPVNSDGYDDYALRPKRIEVGDRMERGDAFSGHASQIWNRIADLSRIVDRGDASIGIPPYNGGLFAPANTLLLDRIRLPDSVLAPVIDKLSFERQGGAGSSERRYINYRDLTVQQLGSIYERLLEHEVVREEGVIAVRPNAFARKNSGSYYTPDELVTLILEKTLEPLFADADAGFVAAMGRIKKSDAEDYVRAELGDADPAQAILRLRICDPAMGSGHFLVSLVDLMADKVLEAMAEATAKAEQAGHEYTSPLADRIGDIRRTILRNAREEGWAIDEAQLDDRHIVRRMVLKRCVYGVDKNPMAVELAKVSLWLHTFTVGAPLSFIDHHLRCGDSLFGLWVRDAIDKASELGGELLWNEALRNAQRQAQAMKTIELATDAEIAEADRSAAMWEDVEFQTGPLDGFVSFMHALDWLGLDKHGKGLVRLWLDGRFGDPIPIARGRKEPEGGKATAQEVEAFAAIWRDARALIEEERFLNWQIAFPGVWQDWASAERKGGFDAIVGNPPWDRIKLQQVEWFAARKPEIALAARASDRKRMIAALEAARDPLFAEYEHASGRAMDALRMARAKPQDAGAYPLLGRGDVNLYSLFVERGHALVRQGRADAGGMVGLLTPSGIASDLSASAFFGRVATGGHLKALFDFENRRTRYGLDPFFPDVDSRFKFAAMIASPKRRFDTAECGFFLQAVTETQDEDRAFAMTAADFARVNPNTGTAPIFRSRRDQELTTAIYARVPVLVDRRGEEPVAAWPVRYRTMFHMTNDSHLFRTRAELEEAEGAWPVGGNRWQSADGEWVPLYVGRMIHQFDHRAASVLINEGNLHNAALSGEVTPEQKADADFTAVPQYWVQQTANLAHSAIAFRDIARATDARTFIASMVPSRAAGNTAPLIIETGSALNDALLLANFNSITLDFVARQKAQSTHLNWYIVEQLPVVPPDAYDRRFGDRTAAEIVREAVLELTYTAHDMAPFACDLGHVDADGPNAGNVLPPFAWDEERRFALRAKLDALYFILYGVWDEADPAKSREDIRYIYSTFPIVEREERARYAGRYRSPELALLWINALMAGRPDADIRD